MIRPCRAILAALMATASLGAHAAALEPCNTTIGPGADVTATAIGMTAGQVLCLNPGTYFPPAAGFPNTNTFAIGNDITVQGLGASPGAVVLQGGAGGDYAVYFVNFAAPKSASGATLRNLTVQGSQGGIQVFNFTGQVTPRLTDITIQDVGINTTAAGGQFGLLLRNVDRINIDNVTMNTTGQTALYMINVTTSLIMNSTITNAVVGQAAAVLGGSNNVIVNNTFGLPKTGATYSFANATNTVFWNSTGNRFENNVVQGQQFDALAFAVNDLMAAYGTPLVPSTDNYVGKNQVISTGYADGQGGGTGIWANCNSHRTWIYGNQQNGAVEGGISVWTSTSNMVLGNTAYGNGIAGVMVSGGAETQPADCNLLTPSKPTNNYVMSNAAYFNKNDQTFFRDVNAMHVVRNFTSPRNGLGGPLFPVCVTSLCQSAIGFDSNLPSSTGNSGSRIVANINSENLRGFYSDDGKTTGVEFAYNRGFHSNTTALNRYITSVGVNFDNGPVTGGNFWTLFPGANADPSVGAPYGTAGTLNPALGVFHNTNNDSGLIVDRYPYKHEHMGRGHTVTVFEPLLGISAARGTRRTVRWDAPGCVYVDLALDGTTALASNLPNTGYGIVTIPLGASIGAHVVNVACKDSAGVAHGSANSPSFNVTSANLQLLAPGRDDTFDAGSTMIVAWKQATAVTSVAVDYSTNAGSSWTTLQTGLTGTFTRVTVPGTTSQSRFMIRVRSLSTSDVDWTDGVFAVRGTGPAFTNVTAGRKFVMGGLERLEWSSPLGSRSVDITATVGATSKTVGTGVPDRGSFDWVMPEFPVGAITLSMTFRNAAGASLGTTSTGVGTAAFPTTITFNPISSLGVGASVAVNPTANSGLAVTMTSTTPSVCSISGGTVNGLANGTCTITFNQAGNGSYAASQARTSFVVQADPPRLGNISTRMQVLTGNDVMIGGFVIGGSANKTVVVRARGPSLVPFGITNALANPTLQLVRSSDQTTVATNDDWVNASNAAAIGASGFAPSNNLESAILVNLPAGAYTAIVSGVGGGTGVGIVEVFEVDHPEVPLVNISTRGQVLTGNDVMIGGFVVQGNGPQTVVVRARGPSLVPFGIPNALMNPTLSLVRSSDQMVIATNDDWQSAGNAGSISALGYAPSDSRESAILITLDPGAYTAVVSGVGSTTGVGIFEVFTTP